MWRMVAAPREMPADWPATLARLNAHAGLFDPGKPVFCGRAPGRLDLMGGIADYSGSLVLQLPLAAATYAFVQDADDDRLCVESFEPHSPRRATAQHPRMALLPDSGPLSFAAARELLASSAEAAWAAYPLGVVVALRGELDLRPRAGLRILVLSDVPVGRGVSSSAALEVAVLYALLGLYRRSLDGRAAALLCQRVENEIVGAPCGVMDQMTAACGQAGRLLALLCQPAELRVPVALPAGLEVWGIDSGIRHAVGGAGYGDVRVGAFMGYRILADVAGLEARGPDAAGIVTIDDPRWRGYLANVTPAEWRGAAFLARYGGTTDRVTRVDPQREYAVRQPTAHPIFENERVAEFRELLLGPASEAAWRAAGERMVASHRSYSACGLGSDGADLLVDLARRAGPERGIYGAKITGGGCGGTVAILAACGARERIQSIADSYAAETGRAALILGGSSDGAAAFGSAELRMQNCE